MANEKIMNNTDWESAAKFLLEQEKTMNSCNYPESMKAIIRWKDNVYIGSIQKIVPNFSTEIVLLSKSTHIIPDELVSAIKKLDKERLELIADESLDLYGRQHVLRLVENRLVYMNHEQTTYMMENPLNICEI